VSDISNTARRLQRIQKMVEPLPHVVKLHKSAPVLPVSQNNELVRLLKLHTLAAEKSGFLDGAQFGVQLGDMLK